MVKFNNKAAHMFSLLVVISILGLTGCVSQQKDSLVSPFRLKCEYRVMGLLPVVLRRKNKKLRKGIWETEN